MTPSLHRGALRGASPFLLLAGLGCGYRFVAPGSVLPTSGRDVQVRMLDNRTSEAGIEALVTESLRREVARVGRLGGEQAEVVLMGEVVRVGDAPALVLLDRNGGVVSTDRGSSAASFKADLTCCVRLLEREGGRQLADACVSGSEDHTPGRDSLETDAAARLAEQRLADRLAREAVEALSRGF